MMMFRVAATILVFVGAVASANLVWNFADMTQGFMVLVNMPIILISMEPAVRCLQDYCKQRKEGKDPTFVASDIGIKDKLDFWQ